MAINVSQSFHRTSANAVDDTLTLTKAEMLAVNDNLMPSKYLTVCQDDGFIYLYDKSATPNQTTGKFTKFEGGGQVDTSKLYSTDDSAESTLADGDYFPFYDTSASGKRKSLWSNVKSTLKTYFDTLYSTVTTSKSASSGGTALSLVTTGEKYTWNNKQNALTAGNNIGISGSTISATNSLSLNYSTSEQVIGTWYDGKPVYQRVLTTGSLSASSTEKFVSLGVYNVKRIVAFSNFYAFTDNNVFDPLYMLARNYGWLSPYIDYNSHTLYLSYKSSLALKDLTFVIQYTKTTD